MSDQAQSPHGRLRESQLFLALTMIIGVLAGLMAVLFSLSIDVARHFLFGMDPTIATIILVPTVVSAFTGILLAKYFPDARGSGVPQTEAVYHLRNGIMEPRVPFGKFVTGVLCIGSGHSMGREGPSVQIGAGLASWVGQWLRLSPDRIRHLVPVGASAALAAAFNTPVAAVLFSLEEIIADMNAPLLGSTVVASVAAVIVERSVLGNEPLFHVPEYHLVHPLELLAYAVLGVLGGLASLAFCKGLLAMRRLFLDLPRWTRVWQPAMGGLAIGLILVFYPQVAGVGYDTVDLGLNGGLALQMMIALCLVKMLATIVSYASGNAGGIFAPSLFLGAMVGGAVGVVTHQLAPFPVGEPGAYALVGMGTLFAGIIRAPMTSVFMIFEITQDYQIFVPLMIANLLAFWVSRRYQAEPVYHALLKQDHVHLPGPLGRKAVGAWRAGDLMSRDVPFVGADAPTAAALAAAVEADVACLLVGSRDHLAGLVSRDRLATEVEAGRGDMPVLTLVSDDWAHVHPDHAIDVVLDRFGRNPGVLPVLSRTDVEAVEGVITAETLMRVFGARKTARATRPPQAQAVAEPPPSPPA